MLALVLPPAISRLSSKTTSNPARVSASATRAPPIYQGAPAYQSAPVYQAPIVQPAPVYQAAPMYQAAPIYQAPVVQAPPLFGELKGNDQWKVAGPAEGQLKGKWWEIFGDPQLNELEERVAIDNFSVKLSEAQFRQALAVIDQNRAAMARHGPSQFERGRNPVRCEELAKFIDREFNQPRCPPRRNAALIDGERDHFHERL